MKKTTQLKKMITSNQLEFIMEAHSGLSAKIVEEAGFKGVWASGLSMSAALGVRDNNEASWSQVLEVVEFMSDATKIPILLDGDTGYGNFNSVRRLVHKLEQRDIAGVCLEDKLFPKTNSFIDGNKQELASIDEFSGKIKAAKDSQKDSDFVVVARVEAFIAGWGLDEAIKRAEAYRLAGADAVLIHSKKSNPSDIEAFMKEWAGRHPVVIVPTKYYSTPTDEYRNLGISLVIWANHNIRACVKALQETSKHIYENEQIMKIEDQIASVSEIFRLQGAEELQEAEKLYLPTQGKSMKAIILAASQGGRFEGLTVDKPKALLKVRGKSILQRQLHNFNIMGVKDVIIIRGFGKEKIDFVNSRTIDNDDYEKFKEVHSLYLAKDELEGDVIISYGDIIYKRFILNELLNDMSDITIIVDADKDRRTDDAQYCDYVTADKACDKMVMQQVQLKNIGPNLKTDQIHGEFIGLWKVNEKGAKILKECLEAFAKQNAWDKIRMYDLINEVAKKTTVSVRYIRGSWLDIDEIADLHKAEQM